MSELLKPFNASSRIAQRTLVVLAPTLVLVFSVVLAISIVFCEARADSASFEGAWAKSHYSKARLIGGHARVDGEDRIFAGVEIVLDKGWKTYWRHPGDAGGVPPLFNWSGSKNVTSAKVLYPVPQRFRDFSGSTVGYKTRVIFPVRVLPDRVGDRVELKLGLRYGICSSICVPVRETLSVTIAPGSAGKLPRALVDALSKVPSARSGQEDTGPKLATYKINLFGDKPSIVLDVDFGGAPDSGDAFVEITGGVYLPMTRRRLDLGPATFAVDLSAVGDTKQLVGETLTFTLVSASGHSVSHIKID